MKIEITGKAVVEATIDFNILKQELKESWNLKKAVYESIHIKEKGEHEEEFIKHTIYCKTRWGLIFEAISRNHTESEIKIFPIKYNDWVRYKPEKLEGGVSILKSENDTNETWMIFYSCLNNPGLAIKNLFGEMSFQFGGIEWKKVVTFK